MADPKTFSPKFDEEQIRGVIDQYARFPNLFNDRDDDIIIKYLLQETKHIKTHL